jgi:xylulokinase
MTERVLVLDVGSSSLKAVLFDSRGTILASCEAAYGLAPAPHRRNPEEWWSAARRAVAELGKTRIDAITLTGTMENLIPVDAGGNGLGDAILYSDPCGSEALAELSPKLGGVGAERILGNRPEPLMTAFKLAWLRRAEPGRFAQAASFLPGAKDAIAGRLTGRAVTDAVTATTTGLMDLKRRAWHDGLTGVLGIEHTRLPAIDPCGAVIGTIVPDAASDLGLDGVDPAIVINGCGDAGATTVGSFCREPGDISLYLGTTGWLARVVAEPETFEVSPVYRLAHPSPGLVIEITPILSAGSATAWARAALSLSDDAAEHALQAADRSPPDLLFLPYLIGERSPFIDTDVRGAFLGLAADHDAAAMYYAVLEGVGLAIRANLDSIDPGVSGHIRLAGGGARSALWPQILADILNRPLSIPDSASTATAYGAFLIAAEALDLPAERAGIARTVAPRPDRRSRADRLANLFAQSTDFARQLRLRADQI